MEKLDLIEELEMADSGRGLGDSHDAPSTATGAFQENENNTWGKITKILTYLKKKEHNLSLRNLLLTFFPFRSLVKSSLLLGQGYESLGCKLAS